MTTQALISNETFQAQLQSSCLPQQRLPYQASHQVELLHLQAETEALLQHLKYLKQQKAVDVL
jgi:hypothetical protein